VLRTGEGGASHRAIDQRLSFCARSLVCCSPAQAAQGRMAIILGPVTALQGNPTIALFFSDRFLP